VPTGDDVAGFERELCDGHGAVLGVSIMTFAGLTGAVAGALAAELAPALTDPQRQALLRAAIRRAAPRRLARSAARPGFAPALDALVTELQAALIDPAAFAALVDELEDPGYERELAALYRGYVELREASGRSDDGALAEAAIAAQRSRPELWGGRPVFVYGFDDLGRAQLELLAALDAAAEVTIAVTYEDRRALAVRASLLGELGNALEIDDLEQMPFDPAYTASPTLRHLDRNLFEPDAGPVEPDGGLTLMRSAGARGEAEAIGIEIARLLAGGYEPDEVAVVVRTPDRSGPLLAAVLGDLGLPVALEAEVGLTTTAVGASLIALCRAALDERDVEALLAHLRLDPALPGGAVDFAERRVRRGSARTVAAVTEGWRSPPRHLAAVAEAADAAGRLHALARAARELAEAPHRERAPLAGRDDAPAGAPRFSAIELRAADAAAELLEQLAAVGALPGCEQPDLEQAIEALESSRIAHWRGPGTGRVRILSPYRARATRVRALFCASLQDGEFPRSTPQDPLLSERRRREIGNPDLRRSEQSEEERYLFHACVSRPTERLYLSWQDTDEEGSALARSPFIDEVLDLLAPDPEAAEARLIRARGPERCVPAPGEATNDRTLARAIALDGWGADRAAILARLGVGGERARTVLDLFEGPADPDHLPGPLASPAVRAELGAREVFSANSLEGWLECPYRWFVDHELSPQRLEPEADPLWLGSTVHAALEQLYRQAPGEDSIPRPGDVGRWRERFRELLVANATERAEAPPNPARRAALDRARIQVEAFLDAEAATETDLRPASELLELGFGPLEGDPGGTEPRPALELDGVRLRGRIDRIDLAPDGRAAVVRDYKTSRSVPRAADLADRGKLQIQLYMLVAARVLGLDPIAGLYQPLAATGERRARGLARAGDERLAGLDLVRSDRLGEDEIERALELAEERAGAAASEMRAGAIGRRPIGGVCPRYCAYQPICRLERTPGTAAEQGDDGNGER